LAYHFYTPLIALERALWASVPPEGDLAASRKPRAGQDPPKMLAALLLRMRVDLK